MGVKKEARKLTDFQVKLLNDTGAEWWESRDGIELNVEQLTRAQLEELIGAGCFTYLSEYEGMSPAARHHLHFTVAKKYAHFFVGEDKPLRNQVVRQSIVQERKVGGFDMLVHPITENGVDTGLYTVAWGQA